MKGWSILFISIFISCFLNAQEHRISTSVGATRFDYFHSFDYSFQKKRLEFGGGLAYGINRSYFQQRFFPKVQLSANYDFIQRPKFELGPCVYTSFSWLKVNKSSNHFTNWQEFFGGLEWNYGNKWKIGQTISAGYFQEHYFNTLQNRTAKASGWGYFVSLKLMYEI